MSGHDDTHTGDGIHALHLALFLVGGCLLGAGIVTLYGKVGVENVPDLNGDFAAIGFNAIDNLTTLPNMELSVVMIVLGIAALVFGNATAWRETGSY